MPKLISIPDYAKINGVTRQAIDLRISNKMIETVLINDMAFIKVSTVPKDVDYLPLNKSFLSIEQAASLLKVGETTIRVMVRSKEIKAYKVRRRIFIDADALNKLVNSK